MKAARVYYYHLHSTGHLYHLSEQQAYKYFINKDPSARLPSGPVHLKLVSFLNFFFKQLKPTPSYQEIKQKYFPLTTEQQELINYFPYLNICMGELNFLNVTDSPIVYHTITVPFKEALSNENTRKLVYAGNLTTEFQINSLSVSQGGKIFHAPPPDHHITKNEPKKLSLISSALAVEMGELFEEKDGEIFIMMTEKGNPTRDFKEAVPLRMVEEEELIKN